MVLADIKAAYMTQHHPVLQPVARPHFGADGGGEAEGLRLDGVGNDLQRPLVVPDDPDIMGVGNAHLQPGLLRTLQGIKPHRLVVGVQDADAGVCGHGLLHKAQIRRVVQRV